MPRPQGGSGSSRQSSGHSYSSRSSSGHRISSGPASRPGMSSGSSNRSFSNGPQQPRSFNQQPRGPLPSPNRSYNNQRRSSPLTGLFVGGMLGNMMGRQSQRRYSQPQPGYMPSYGPGMQPRRRSSGWIWIVILVIFLMIGFGMCGCSSSADSNIPVNSYNREKLQNSVAFDSNCIVDELDFFENPSKTGQQLKSFYDQTGVQPYIVIEDYNPSLRTDAQKEEYAKQYYDKYINNEDTFLYMYFADADPNSIGYMATVNGKNTEAVMDSQAVETFWNYLDQEWTSGKETDEMFVDVFNQTAKRIMTKTTTGNDVAMRGLLIGGIVIVAAVVVILVLLKQKRDREKAEETRRILETPLRTEDPDDDDLVNRYGG